MRTVATAVLCTVVLGSSVLTGSRAAGMPAAPERRAAHAIDTSDKEAVRDAYRTRFRDNVELASGWVGNAALCLAGTVSQEAQDGTLESVNFVRAMAGLDAVGLGEGLSAKAQQAALMMDANDSLSHDPPPSWKCWTEEGADAAGHSNLAWTSGTMSVGEAIELYMDDQGPSNKVVGHRRWILRPEAKTFGNGMTDTTSALWVIGPTSSRKANPRWVSWPTAGWFPAGLQPHGRWSISSGDDDADFSQATVSVREVRGSRLDVRTYTSVDGYAQPTLVFKVAGLERDGKYRVTVRGVRRTADGSHSYVVKLFG